MLERLLILINTSVDYAASVWLFRNIFLLRVSKQRRNPAVSLKTVSLFSLDSPWYVGYWFCCQRQQIEGRATQTVALCTCVSEKPTMRIRKEKSARKRVCVCMHRCLCVCETDKLCVCLGSSAARLQISSISLSQAQGLLGKWQTAPWLWQQRLHPNFPTECLKKAAPLLPHRPVRKAINPSIWEQSTELSPGHRRPRVTSAPIILQP